MKIAIISDTHSYIDDRILHHTNKCSEVWHAGDIGSLDVTDQLAKKSRLKAVHGNIDDREVRACFPAHHVFETAGKTILMTHIAGNPKNYPGPIEQLLKRYRPDILVCGHSHILKVVKVPLYDNMLHINPGAAGRHGFHKVRTMIRLEIIRKEIANLEVIELGPRSKVITV